MMTIQRGSGCVTCAGASAAQSDPGAELRTSWFNRVPSQAILVRKEMIAMFACKLVLSCALLSAAALVVSAAVPPGSKLLARSEFHWDNDGWKGYSKRRVVRVEVDMGQVMSRASAAHMCSTIQNDSFYPPLSRCFSFDFTAAARVRRRRQHLVFLRPALVSWRQERGIRRYRSLSSAPLCPSPYSTQARCRSPSATASTTVLASALKKSVT